MPMSMHILRRNVALHDEASPSSGDVAFIILEPVHLTAKYVMFLPERLQALWPTKSSETLVWIALTLIAIIYTFQGYHVAK